MDQGKDSLSQITARRDSQGESLPLNGTCLQDKTNKARNCAAVVSTSISMTILKNVYMSNDQK
jgi:hypothetical protein